MKPPSLHWMFALAGFIASAAVAGQLGQEARPCGPSRSPDAIRERPSGRRANLNICWVSMKPGLHPGYAGYGVTTKRFNEQVSRNAERFPADFMFQLTDEEWTALRSQFATLKTGRGQHRKYLPYVFTEHGAIMAATILSSP